MKTYKLRASQCPVHKGLWLTKTQTGTVEVGLGNGFWLCVTCREIRQDKKD